MTQLKPIDFAGAVIGILIIGLATAFAGGEQGSPEWWSVFFKSYVASIVPFCISCGMIARRAGAPLSNALWGVLAAFGVFVVTANALQKKTA